MFIYVYKFVLYTVHTTIINYCRIVSLNHTFHCNLCNEKIKKLMNISYC